MPADDLDERARPFIGFHSYADDTPRDYQHAAGPGYGAAEPAFGRERPNGRRLGWWIGGGAVAAVAGVLLAVGLRDPAPQAPASPAMGVEVAARTPPAPLPEASFAPKLEVLPPGEPPPVEQFIVEQAVPLQSAPEQAAAAPVRVLPPAPAAAAPPVRDAVASAPERPVAPRAAPPPPARRSFACQDLPTRAMTMVCGDPRLARLDLRMKRAYEAALQAGASPRVLRADQDDWLAIREEAARVSRRSVANVYHQRIAELEDLSSR